MLMKDSGRKGPGGGSPVTDFIFYSKGNCAHWNVLSEKVTKSVTLCFQKNALGPACEKVQRERERETLTGLVAVWMNSDDSVDWASGRGTKEKQVDLRCVLR